MTSGLFASYLEDFNESVQRLETTAQALRDAVRAEYDGDQPQQEQRPHATTTTTMAGAGPVAVSVGTAERAVTGSVNRAQQMHALQQELAHLRDLVTSMSYESNDVAEGAAQRDAKVRVAECKQIVLEIEKSIARLRQEAREADRRDLLSVSGDTNRSRHNNGMRDDEQDANRALMLENTSRLRGGTTVLHRAEALLQGAQDTGTAALSTLRTQTETMQHIRCTIHDADAEVMDSRRIVNRMQTTALKHKVILIGIIVSLLFLIVGFIVFR